MIQIVVKRNASGHIGAFEINGHAGSVADDEYDLLCCAVSTLSQATVMGLQDVVGISGDEFLMEDSQGLLHYHLPARLTDQTRHDADILLESMCVSLRALALAASNYIHYNETMK